jgi:hypothetical protein
MEKITINMMILRVSMALIQGFLSLFMIGGLNNPNKGFAKFFSFFTPSPQTPSEHQHQNHTYIKPTPSATKNKNKNNIIKPYFNFAFNT